MFVSWLSVMVSAAVLGLTCGYSFGFWNRDRANCKYLDTRISRLDMENKKLQKSIQALQNNVVHCVSGEIKSAVNKNKVKKFNESKSFYFPKPFRDVPEVTIGIYQLDLLQGANTRVVASKRVTKDRLTVTFHSWADTIFFHAEVSFMACGKI